MDPRVAYAFLAFFVTTSFCLDNGLVRTPPMGWLSWARYTCNIDCETYPDECISERLYKTMADLMVSEGYKDAGYEYVNIDDCWSEMDRDQVTGRLVPDKKRFPSGIKPLADYVHSKGLKLGIYGDIGTKTCAGYPGFLSANSSVENLFLLDALTFAEWGIDSLKVDGCNGDIRDYDRLYPRLGTALNLTGRSIVYSCSWPAYLVGEKIEPNYANIAKSCNLWRNFDDIQDTWTSVTSIIDYYQQHQATFVKYNGPGAWFDPDMVLVGDFGLSYEQSKAQMAFWALFSAPLYMSNNLSAVAPEYKAILQNRRIIEVNQDRLGIMGQQVIKDGNKEVWVKPVEPILSRHSSFAVLYFNRNVLGVPPYFNYSLATILNSFQRAPYYYVLDLFGSQKPIAKLSQDDNLILRVNTSGGVSMVKLIPAVNIWTVNWQP